MCIRDSLRSRRSPLPAEAPRASACAAGFPVDSTAGDGTCASSASARLRNRPAPSVDEVCFGSWAKVEQDRVDAVVERDGYQLATEREHGVADARRSGGDPDVTDLLRAGCDER